MVERKGIEITHKPLICKPRFAGYLGPTPYGTPTFCAIWMDGDGRRETNVG